LIRRVIDFKEIEVKMKRKFYIVILLALAPTLVNALGLGHLDLNSALNEPFDARIQLLSPTADELDSLTVGLADSEAFARAKIDRPFILGKLKFTLRRSADDGPDYIRVYSQEPIREPFLNFLVELSWSNGRLFREYTVLLDPPLYDPNARASEFVQDQASTYSAEPMAEAVTIDDPDHKVVYSQDFEQTSSPTYTPNVNYTGGDYGPTAESDTLWSIASAMRPDSSISVNKMMSALLRANPEAFFNQNINGLKRGQILRMPTESEVNALNNAQALAEVQSQHAAWDGIKDNLSSVVTERPAVSSTPESSSASTDDAMDTVEAAVESDPELKLVAAEETGEATQQVASVDSGQGEDLILAQESIQALTHENMELKDRLQESEALLDDLKRLLSLKDDELAALQGQMTEQPDMMEEEVETAAEEEVVSEDEEEIFAEVEEEAVDDETAMDDAEDEMLVEDEEELETIDEEEVVDVIDDEPASSSDGIMGMVDQYLGPVKEILLGNPMIGMAVAGVFILLILIIVIMKFRKEPAETLHIDAMTEEAFPDFDSGDLGDTGAEVPDSEAVTILPPDSEAETAMPEAAADLVIEEAEPEPEPIAEEAPVEEESDEDPMQEVNTYLAFEQFDQAEEFVRSAINDSPDNAEYHTKLLEVFYTSGNKKSYEEEAKVLHDKFGEANEHWNMAVAMWSEMSPNRALFEEGADDEEDDADNTGGFVDVTADDEAGNEDAGLDFDIGGAEESPADEGMLDITGSDEGEAMLDITAADEGEDMLDVTAAVGLDDSVADDDVLDISSAGSDDLLDLTAGDESSGDDLLDVTAAANLDLDSEEDLLDVTAATSAGADSSELLGLNIEPEADSLEIDVPEENATIELDQAVAIDEETMEIPASDDDNVLDFDLGTNDENVGLEIEASEPEDAGLEIDLGVPELDLSDAEDVGLDIGLDVPEEDTPIRLDAENEAEDEISLDFDMGEDDGLELDLSAEADSETPEIELEMDTASEAETVQIDSADMDFDLSMDDTPELSLEDDAGLDETVEIPKSIKLDVDVDEDDDDDEHTVFVPRASQPDEQTAEDEIATKLDLAKAYVELGDKDSAKTILDEVMADGNDEQRKQAEDLLGQV
jgi:pilus assembly protein FimV